MDSILSTLKETFSDTVEHLAPKRRIALSSTDSSASKPRLLGLQRTGNTAKRNALRAKRHRDCDSSFHPIEWLDKVLETSILTRTPLEPFPYFCKVPVSKMEAATSNVTPIRVHLRHGDKLKPGQPRPKASYPGLKAALQDICDNFGDMFYRWAEYHIKEKAIYLYPVDQRPMVDPDTIVFNLQLARNAWGRVDRVPAAPISDHNNNSNEEHRPATPVSDNEEDFEGEEYEYYSDKYSDSDDSSATTDQDYYNELIAEAEMNNDDNSNADADTWVNLTAADFEKRAGEDLDMNINMDQALDDLQTDEGTEEKTGKA
ncbi:hypothetical protein F5Y16DRAFT_299337 [Xylariaceae sp. FL0255]|nr:hypothetical protein F5Y16DRAFT_299337 [Xylariaceae sp. FL0255]